jgi:hypothetical protein
MDGWLSVWSKFLSFALGVCCSSKNSQVVYPVQAPLYTKIKINFTGLVGISSIYFCTSYILFTKLCIYVLDVITSEDIDRQSYTEILAERNNK